MCKNRKRKLRLYEKNPFCYWCGCRVVMVDLKRGDKQPANLATLDHLDTRLSDLRGAFPGKERTVLACRACNHKRGRIDQSDAPIEELWRRAGRAPSGGLA